MSMRSTGIRPHHPVSGAGHLPLSGRTTSTDRILCTASQSFQPSQPFEPPVSYSGLAAATPFLRQCLQWHCHPAAAPSGAPSSVPSGTSPATNAPPAVRPRPMPPEYIVMRAQVKLRTKLYAGAIDGKMTEQFRAAVRAFQGTQQLPQTGNLDNSTLAKLGIVTEQPSCHEARERTPHRNSFAQVVAFRRIDDDGLRGKRRDQRPDACTSASAATGCTATKALRLAANARALADFRGRPSILSRLGKHPDLARLLGYRHAGSYGSSADGEGPCRSTLGHFGGTQHWSSRPLSS